MEGINRQILTELFKVNLAMYRFDQQDKLGKQHAIMKSLDLLQKDVLEYINNE